MNYIELWRESLLQDINCNEFVNMFLSKDYRIFESIYSGSDKDISILVDIFKHYTEDDIINVLINAGKENSREYFVEDIVQFSSFVKATEDIPKILQEEVNGITYVELGGKLHWSEKEGARRKYGENQAKLAALFGLVRIDKKSNSITKIVTKTSLGNYYYTHNNDIRFSILRKMIFTNPLIQQLIIDSYSKDVRLYDYLTSFITDKTYERRKGNVKAMFQVAIMNTKYEYLKDRVDWK